MMMSAGRGDATARTMRTRMRRRARPLAPRQVGPDDTKLPHTSRQSRISISRTLLRGPRSRTRSSRVTPRPGDGKEPSEAPAGARSSRSVRAAWKGPSSRDKLGYQVTTRSAREREKPRRAPSRPPARPGVERTKKSRESGDADAGAASSSARARVSEPLPQIEEEDAVVEADVRHLAAHAGERLQEANIVRGMLGRRLTMRPVPCRFGEVVDD